MTSSRGFSLVELMVAMAIGLIVVLGLTIVIARSSASQRELALANRQVENGRYAMKVLVDEIHNAGFFGTLAATPEPKSAPTICGKTAADYKDSLSPGVFVFSPAEADFSANCKIGTVAVGAVADTDVLMVIRADSSIMNWPALDATTKPTGNSLYVQSNGQAVVVDTGGGTFNLTQTRCPLNAATPPDRPWCAESAKVSVVADIRRLHVSVFYVSPCNRPSTGDYAAACDAQADDGRPIPTLKRLDLENGVWVARPVAEGIENLQIELGLDDTPLLDGAPDGFLAVGATAPTVDQLKNVVAVGVNLLAVNTDRLGGHTDTKTYLLGTTPVSATNDGFKRHVVSRTVRLNNAAGRREP